MYILPIVGIIGEPEEEDKHLPHFRYTDLLMHLNAAKDHADIMMIFDTDGGDVEEGKKMKQALKDSGKILHSRNTGNVASMGVDLWLLSNDRKFDPSKGLFLIHNPWALVEGDGDTMAEASKELKSIENEFIKDYAKRTGSNESVLKGFMAENKPLTPEQIESLGFATIVKQEFKAVAKFNINKNNMEVKELKEKVTLLEKGIDKIANLFTTKPKNLMLQDTNGTQLDFGDEIETPEQIQVGVTAKVDGVPAEGEFVMEDGTTYIFTAGELTEIVPSGDEMEALKKENEDLKAELETLKNSNAETVAKLEEKENELVTLAKRNEQIEKEFNGFKSQFSEFKTKANLSQSDDRAKNKRTAFKKK